MITQAIELYHLPFWFNLIVLIGIQAWNVFKQRSLAKQNAELSEATNVLQEKLNEKQHISQQRFDLELKVYISLSEKLNNVIDNCSVLFPMINDEKFQDEKLEMKRRFQEFSDTYNIFVKEQRSYAPFYSKDIRKDLDDISSLLKSQYVNFKFLYCEPDMESWAKKHMDTINQKNKDLSNLQSKIIDLITERLDELSV